MALNGTNEQNEKFLQFCRRGPTSLLVGKSQMCDCPLLMASSADPRVSSGNAPCVHPRLILETETSTKDRYLTGHYICEVCGQHFDRPPIKQDPPRKHDPPPTP